MSNGQLLEPFLEEQCAISSEHRAVPKLDWWRQLKGLFNNSQA